MKELQLSVKFCCCDLCGKRTKKPIYHRHKKTYFVWFFDSNQCAEKFIKSNAEAPEWLVTLH